MSRDRMFVGRGTLDFVQWQDRHGIVHDVVGLFWVVTRCGAVLNLNGSEIRLEELTTTCVCCASDVRPFKAVRAEAKQRQYAAAYGMTPAKIKERYG